MRLQRILLRRMPGIQPPFELEDLAPGINVILGPQGCGKTSLCRAVRLVLWPGCEKDGRFEVVTTWDDGSGRKLYGERDGVRVVWQADGADTGEPTLPPAHLARCYTLGLRDLLQDERSTDATLANQIHVQMSGGYDLEAVRRTLFKVRTRGRPKEARDLQAALGAVREVEMEFKGLARSEAELPEAERLREEAGAAVREVPLLQHAIELATARRGLKAIDLQLSSLPEALGSYDGKERELLGELEEEVQRSGQLVQRRQSELDSAREAERETGLSGDDPDQVTLEGWSERVTTLSRIRQDSDRARQEGEDARARRDKAEQQLKGHQGLQNPPQVTDEALRSVEALIRDLDRWRREMADLDRRIADLDANSRSAGDGRPKESAARLRSWLAASSGGGIPPAALRPVVAGVLVSLGAAVLAIFMDGPWPGIVGAVAATVSILAAASLWRRPQGDERAAVQRDVLERGLSAPTTWTREHVSQLVDQLDDAAFKLRQQEQRADELDTVRRRREEAQEPLDGLLRQREALQQDLGLHVDSDAGLLVFAHLVRDFNDAVADVAGAEAQGSAADRELDEALDDADAFLTAFGYDRPGDPDQLRVAVEDLKSRLSGLQAARRDVDARERSVTEARSGLERAQEKLDGMYEHRGVPVGEREALLDILKLHPQWAGLQKSRQEQGVLITNLEARLSDRPAWASLPVETAERLHQEAADTADALTERVGRISEITEAVKLAQQGSRLTDALARCDAEQAALRDAHEKALHGTAGRFLLGQVASEHQQTSRPPVLQRAMDTFAAFTRNQYELVPPSHEGEEFRARDTSTDKGLSLSELSDGTRVQLLLAVRLAFALNAEGDHKLPLILDEALSTADPVRFRAVADSLTLLASDGRQVFYMTANPSDAQQWTAVGETSNTSPAHIIELAKVRGWQAAADTEVLKPPTISVVPEPGDMRPEEYARKLMVPPINLQDPVGSLHLYYLLSDDLDQLHMLMQRFRLNTVGQWQSFSASLRANRLLDEPCRRRLDALTECARLTFQARAIGRGRPVDRDALATSGAVTSTFLERLTELSRELRGDGSALVKALRAGKHEHTKRFRSASIEELEAYLESEGYIDGQEPLDDAAIRFRVLEASQEAVEQGILTEEDCGRVVDRLLHSPRV